MEKVSDRLRSALELPGRPSRTMRSLHRQLQKEGRFDGSHSSLYRYFTGETEAPTTFVVEVAAVLGVLPEWLLTGNGARTEEERPATLSEVTLSQATLTQAMMLRGSDMAVDIARSFNGALNRYTDLPLPARMILFQYLVRRMRDREAAGSYEGMVRETLDTLSGIVGKAPGRLVGGSEDKTVVWVLNRLAAAWLEDCEGTPSNETKGAQ